MKRDLLFGGIAGLSGWLLGQIGSVAILQLMLPTWFGQIVLPILVGAVACALLCAKNAKSYGIRIAIAAPVFVLFAFLLNLAPMIANCPLPAELVSVIAGATNVYCSIGFLAGVLLAFPLSALLFVLRQKKANA